MKQVFISNNGRVVKDVPLPTLGDKEILVSIYTSVISTGTETGGDKKLSVVKEKKEVIDKVVKMISENGLTFTIQKIKSKLTTSEQNILLNPIGYSNAGVIISKGRFVTNFNVGDRVACCGAGVASHAEYVTIPVNMAAKLEDNVSFTSGAFTTIGSIAMQGIRRSEVKFGETVVILGLGLLGLLAVQIAKSWGLVVIGVDLNEERNKLAKKLGADFCINANNPNIIQEIKQYTNGIGADSVIIYAATKSSVPVNQAFDFCRRKGRVVVVGDVGMELDRSKMYEKELDFVISTSYGPGRYDENYEVYGNDYPIGYVRWTENRNMLEFIRLLSVGKVNVEPLISGEYNVIDAIKAFDSLIQSQKNIANVIKYSHELDIDHSSGKFAINSGKIIDKEKIKVGIIGAGGFIKAKHLSNMLKLKDKYEIIAICNHTPGSSVKEGENYNVKYVSTDYNELLNDKDIDLIVIGTRHNIHAEIVVKAINAKKNVLVEKPLALTLEEINEVKKAINNNSEVNVFVGFNRRYSPFIQSIKKELSIKNKPIVINYRINAGYIDSNSWVQSPKVGGGRLIGEGCHFIDLISYLSGGELEVVNIINIPVSNNVTSEDNFVINMKYSNGNIGVLTYTSVGGDKMPKERLEVFCDKSSYVIDDFKILKAFDNNYHETKLKEIDKGHYKLIEEIYKKLTGKPSLIESFDLDLKSSEQAIRFVNIINGHLDEKN